MGQWRGDAQLLSTSCSQTARCGEDVMHLEEEEKCVRVNVFLEKLPAFYYETRLMGCCLHK